MEYRLILFETQPAVLCHKAIVFPVQGRLQNGKLRIVCALHLRVQDRSQRIPDPHEGANSTGILSRQTYVNHDAVLTVIHLPVHFRI